MNHSQSIYMFILLLQVFFLTRRYHALAAAINNIHGLSVNIPLSSASFSSEDTTVYLNSSSTAEDFCQSLLSSTTQHLVIEGKKFESINILKYIKRELNTSKRAVKLGELPLTNDHLKHLDVSFNVIDNRGYRIISTIIATSIQLNSFFCNGNTLENLDVQSLAYAIKSHPMLKILSLSNCYLTDASFTHISSALKLNRNLTHLDLSINELSADAMTEFYACLKAEGGRSLEYLDLSYNPIGELGLHAIADAINNGYLSNLKHLRVRQIGAGPNSLESLFKSASKLHDIECIDTSGNALILKKKKAGKLSGMNKHLVNIHKVATNSIENLMSYIPTTSSTVVSTRSAKISTNKKKKGGRVVTGKMGRGGKESVFKKGRSAIPDSKPNTKRGLGSKVVKTQSSTNTAVKGRKTGFGTKLVAVRKKSTEDLKKEYATHVALQSKKRLFGYIAHMIASCPRLREVGLIKVHLDEEACKILVEKVNKISSAQNNTMLASAVNGRQQLVLHIDLNDGLTPAIISSLQAMHIA